MRLTWKTWTLRKKDLGQENAVMCFKPVQGYQKYFYDASKNTFDNQPVNCHLQQLKRKHGTLILSYYTGWSDMEEGKDYLSGREK